MIVCPSRPILPPVSLNGTLSCTWEALTGIVCVCVHVHAGWSRVAEVGLYFRDKASKSYGWLPRYRHLLSGSERLLRHQWINFYSYASIHHPPPFSSGRSTPQPPHAPHSRSLWIIWGFGDNPAKPHSQKFCSIFEKKKEKKKLFLSELNWR